MASIIFRCAAGHQTTQRFYINPTSQMQDAVSDMPVPAFLEKQQKDQVEGTENGGEK